MPDAAVGDINAAQYGGLPYIPPHWCRPAGAVRQSLDRAGAHANLSGCLSTGRLYMQGVYYAKGEIVSNLVWMSATTALSSGSNQWSALFDADRNKLAISADATSGAWAANTAKTFALSASYTIPSSGLYYHGLCVVASTVPTLAGQSTLAGIQGIAPILSGYADTGLTNPASCPTTAAAITALNVTAWTYST